MTNELLARIQLYEQQIQSHKQKEDKIRAICIKNESGKVYYLEDNIGTVEERILNILNEGVIEND